MSGGHTSANRTSTTAAFEAMLIVYRVARMLTEGLGWGPSTFIELPEGLDIGEEVIVVPGEA